MTHIDPMKRLREICAEDRHDEAMIEARRPERDELIRRAARYHTQGKLAVATGLDQSSISRILMRRT